MKKENEREESKIKEIQGYFKEKKNRGQIIAIAAACLVVMVICVVALAQGLRRGAAPFFCMLIAFEGRRFAV